MEREDIVLDASVIIKWFTQEEDKEKAIELREQFLKGEIEIVCPDLILYELTNALRYNQKFNQEDVEKAAESLSEMELTIVLPLTSMLQKAIELSFTKNITIYDAIYVALASELNCKFITADKKLHDKVKDLSFVLLLSDIK